MVDTHDPGITPDILHSRAGEVPDEALEKVMLKLKGILKYRAGAQPLFRYRARAIGGGEMEIEETDDYIAVHGDFEVLSSAFYNGGYRRARTLINLHVPHDFDADPVMYFDSFIKRVKLAPETTVGMMTAVPMPNARILKDEGITAIITAGLSLATVNIILTINRPLSQSAMANVMIVATEAKTAAFYDLDLRDCNGDLFTGDLTDSVVVACAPVRNKADLFAGKGTELGKRIYDMVREGVKAALQSHNGLSMDRPILKRLEERGITLQAMVDTALELYVSVEGEERDMDRLRQRLESQLIAETADPNVALLLAAAIHAEEQEILKGRAGHEGMADAASIVADELIGIDIAEYIGGKRALFNFFYYDTRKPGILRRLGVFMDDAIGGLIAGCMSKMLQD